VASLKLRPDEEALIVGRPALSVVWPKYILTLGLYNFWRKRHTAVLTNQRLMLAEGILSRRERTIPRKRIRGAAYVRRGMSAYCEVALTDREGLGPPTRVGPLKSRTARRFVEEIEEGI
jgi:hypothetical protein